MELRKLVVAVAAAFALAPMLPANAALTVSSGDIRSPNVVTFDDFDGLVGVGPTQVGSLLGMDVLFTSSAPSTLGAFIADLGLNGLWGAGEVFAATGSPFDVAPSFGLLHYTFTDMVTSGAGAKLNALDGGPMLVIAYGASGAILEAHAVSTSTPGGVNDGAFFGIVRPGADIRSIAFSGTGLVMDNLTFTTPVPEPSTWAFMLAGLGLAGWAGLRRGRARRD